MNRKHSKILASLLALSLSLSLTASFAAVDSFDTRDGGEKVELNPQPLPPGVTEDSSSPKFRKSGGDAQALPDLDANSHALKQGGGTQDDEAPKEEKQVHNNPGGDPPPAVSGYGIKPIVGGGQFTPPPGGPTNIGSNPGGQPGTPPGIKPLPHQANTPTGGSGKIHTHDNP